MIILDSLMRTRQQQPMDVTGDNGAIGTSGTAIGVGTGTGTEAQAAGTQRPPSATSGANDRDKLCKENRELPVDPSDEQGTTTVKTSTIDMIRHRNDADEDNDGEDSNSRREKRKRKHSKTTTKKKKSKQQKKSRSKHRRHKKEKDGKDNGDSNTDSSKKYDSESDDDDDCSSDDSSRDERHYKKSQKRKKKRSHRSSSRSRSRRHDDSSDDDDSDTSSESGNQERRSRSRSKKKSKTNKRSSLSAKKSSTAAAATFGTYGILSPAADFSRMQRTFDVWMEEVHGLSTHSGGRLLLPKWQVQQYFATFCEDFNTATMPHEKYYNYDAWEQREYDEKTNPSTAQTLASTSNTTGNWNVHADERAHQQSQRDKRQRDELIALRQAAATLSRDKVSDMLHQQQLQVQMQMAFAQGDRDLYRQLKDKLAADE